MALRYAFNRTVRTPVVRRCESAASIISFPTPFPRNSGATITAPRNARPSYVVVVSTPTRRLSRSAAKQPSGESASSRRKSSRVYPHASRSVRAIAASMSRSSSLRIRVPSTTSPVARALPARHIRGIRTSRSACPCGDACTCTGRTRRPPGRTTCRSPCTDAFSAIAPGGPLHSPERILLPLDRAEFVEDLGLVVAQLLSAAERACVGLRQVHVQDAPDLDLPSDRDPIGGDRPLLPLNRPIEAFLTGSDRLDPPEGTSLLTHQGLASPDAPREHAHTEDGGLRGPERVVWKEEKFRGICDLLPARFLDLALPFVPPGLIVFDEPIDHITLEKLHVVVVLERGLRVRQDVQVERQDGAVQRILDRRRVRHIPSGDRSQAGELDRNARLLTFVREALEGTDRIGLHEDAILLRLDMDLRLLRDLFDNGIEVAFRGPDGRSRDGAFESAAEDLDAGGRGHARHGVESFLRVANLIQGFRLEQRLHLRRARLSRGPEDDRVSLRQRAFVEDRIERDPEAFLLLHLEDRPDRGAVRRGELLLQESLRQADEHQEEVGNAFAKFRTNRDDRDVRREVRDAIVSFGGEAVLVQPSHEFVHPLVELVSRRDRLVLIRHHKGLAFVLPPAWDQVDLVRGHEEGRLVPLQDVQALDRLRTESFVDVDYEDGQVRERAASSPQGREGHVARRVDEEQPGDAEGLALHEVAAGLHDRRKGDLGRADVLRDAARFPSGDARASDAVEEGGLPMVHVSEDGDDGLADRGHRPRRRIRRY